MRIFVCLMLVLVPIFSAEVVAQATPNLVGELNRLGVTEFQNGNYARSVQLLEEAAKRAPKNGLIYYNLGTAYFLSKNLEKARRAFSIALELEPHSAAVLNQLAVTQLEQGD